jgi:hypothetical protein
MKTNSHYVAKFREAAKDSRAKKLGYFEADRNFELLSRQIACRRLDWDWVL